MKDWSELESKYQDMKDKDSKRAQQFRNDMTTVKNVIDMFFVDF